MKKYVVFDFDCTIAETFQLCLDSFDRAFEQLGINKPTRDELFALFGTTELGILKKLDKDKAQVLFEAYLQNYKKHHSEYITAPFENILEVLQYLKSKDCRLALVTGRAKESADISLDILNLRQYFDHILCGGEDSNIKVANFKKLAELWNSSTSEFCYVGDSPQDIIDSHECNMEILSVRWSKFASPKELLESLKPTAIFENTQDFLAFFLAFVKGRDLL